MHILQASARLADAQQRLTRMAGKLAETFRIDPEKVTALTFQENDSMIRSIRLTEAMADFLEAVIDNAGATQNPTLEQYIQEGYSPESYPPTGYKEVDSPALRAYREDPQKFLADLEAQQKPNGSGEEKAPATDEKAQAEAEPAKTPAKKKK